MRLGLAGAVGWIVAATLVSCAVGCARARSGERPAIARPDRPAEPPPPAAEPALTPQEAKRAIIELIRANPTLFIGDPDPDVFEKLEPLHVDGDEWALGVFVMNVKTGVYTADIGPRSGFGEVYWYNGRFEQQGGVWRATEPELTRAWLEEPQPE